ncbi:MAG: phage tail protein [Candidatus Aminicenantes bacterium]|jgi:phage tail-like protein|nr:phage tail protein [Candidatus Aminicenantes bacterium]
MAVGQRNDPYRNNRFILEIDSIKQAGFSDATIPDSTQDPIDYREGNEPPTVRKIPGLIKYGNVTLKWGTTDSMELYKWRQLVEQGKMKDARRNVAVILLDEEGGAKCRWEFSHAWPNKYDAPDFSAKGNEIAIETLEIAHEGMKRVK